MRKIFLILCILITGSVFCGGQDLDGYTKNYEFKKIGWTVSAPLSWETMSNAEFEKFEKRGLDSIKNNADGDLKIIDTKPINLITIRKDAVNYFISTMQRIDTRVYNFSKSMVVTDSVVYATFTSMKMKCDTSTETVKIDGLAFHAVHVKLYAGSNIVHEDMYSRVINGYLVSFIAAYLNDDTKQTMTKILKSSKFAIRD